MKSQRQRPFCVSLLHEKFFFKAGLFKALLPSFFFLSRRQTHATTTNQRHPKQSTRNRGPQEWFHVLLHCFGLLYVLVPVAVVAPVCFSPTFPAYQLYSTRLMIYFRDCQEIPVPEPKVPTFLVLPLGRQTGGGSATIAKANQHAIAHRQQWQQCTCPQRHKTLFVLSHVRSSDDDEDSARQDDTKW